MKINLTILVQIFNFLVGYFILSRLLFKPALNIIRADIKQKETLQNNIEEEKIKFNNKLNSKKDQWEKCRDYFALKKPKDIDLLPIKLITSSISLPSKLSDEEKNKLSSNIIQNLKKKVIHG